MTRWIVSWDITVYIRNIPAFLDFVKENEIECTLWSSPKKNWCVYRCLLDNTMERKMKKFLATLHK